MSQQFNCSVCGITTTQRSHFYWLVAFVAFLFGEIWISTDGPMCKRCAPRWATAIGRALYILIAIGFVLAVWKFSVFGNKIEKTSNSLTQSEQAASINTIHTLNFRPAADFESGHPGRR